MPQPSGTVWRSQPRTLLKHQIYRWYLDCWMGKICQRFPEAVVVDAFAGPGFYEDGPEGSPVVIADSFIGHARRPDFNLLRLICAEARADRRDSLAERLARLPRVPALHIQEPTLGALPGCFPALSAAAHGRDSGTPVLWILDPFDYSSVPFSLVSSCLRGPRDEVLITWFADEIYRFVSDRAKEQAIDAHFGTGSWREARSVMGEAARKEHLLKTYQQSLQAISGVQTGAFSIASKNESARYSLVLATHSDAGLQCFNQAKWRMDKHRGHHVSEKRGLNQPSLFDEMPELSPLRKWLEGQAGRALSFGQLAVQAGRLGFKETHLRDTLTGMSADGLAVRESPLDYTSSPWPPDSVIRFYAPP